MIIRKKRLDLTRLSVSHEITSRDVIAFGAIWKVFISTCARHSYYKKKRERKNNSLGRSVNDSPGILYHDNKRPLRKAGSRCSVHVTRTSCAVSVSISLSLFSLSRWPPYNVAEEQRGKTREWEERYGGASVDSPCQTNDPFRAGKSLDSRGLAFVALFSLTATCLAFFCPVSAAENSPLLQNYILAFPF